jgi:hypothetical protein
MATETGYGAMNNESVGISGIAKPQASDRDEMFRGPDHDYLRRLSTAMELTMITRTTTTLQRNSPAS